MSGYQDFEYVKDKALNLRVTTCSNLSIKVEMYSRKIQYQKISNQAKLANQRFTMTSPEEEFCRYITQAGSHCGLGFLRRKRLYQLILSRVLGQKSSTLYLEIQP